MHDDEQRDLPLDERRGPARPPAAPREVAIKCPNCGYNLTGVQLGSSCPECNLVIGHMALGGGHKPTSGYAVASLVLGICSITIGCGTYGLLSAVCGPLALLYAAKAGKQIRAGGVSASSGGLKTAGFVTGLIGTIVGLIAVVLIAGFFVLMITASSSSSGWQNYPTTPPPAPATAPTPAPSPARTPAPATAPTP